MNQPNITVLAVDDSQDILFALSAICELEGWRTLTTTEGSEAIELVRQSRPDIVLVDYHMPRMDGIEVVRNIRAADPAVPIVVLTIESSRAVADSFLAAGADDFALKPIKPIDLISRIRVHLRAAGRAAAPAASAEKGDQPARGNALAVPDEYVKGISPLTLSIICNCLRFQKEFLTINETAGLGMNAQNPEFMDQFIGKEGSFNLVKDGASGDNDIQALSGATITSTAVTNAMNAALYLIGSAAE